MAVFLLWGLNFTAMKVCLEYSSPLVFSSLSFGAGALAIVYGTYKDIRFKYWEGALVVGLSMCASSAMQAYALNHTLVAKTAFYAILDIPITAVIEFQSRYLDRGEIFGVICAVLGAFLLSWNGQSISPNIGDWYSIGACLPSSIYFVACDHYSTAESKTSLCMGQLLVTTIVCAVISPALEIPRLELDWVLLGGLVITGCLSCGVALFVLTWAQIYTTPTRTCIIGAPEPVFAAIVAYFVYGERLDSYVNVIGGLFLLLALLSPVLFVTEGKTVDKHTLDDMV